MDVIQFSGGKDSQAVIHWYQKNIGGKDAVVVFCDTGHESAVTYKHIKYIAQNIPYPIVTLKSKKYENMFDLAKKKKRFPSTMARFCTTELKVVPFIDFVLEIKEDLTIYQGIRHEESRNRATMLKRDDYFKSYFEGGKNLHRKKDVLNWCQSFDACVVRPIITWTTKEVFNFISDFGIKRNSLYDKGCSRVGCYPCIMIRKGEILNMLEHEEGIEVFKKIAAFEKEHNTSFFPPNYIPERFSSKSVINQKGELVKVPLVKDVIKYIKSKNQTLDMFASSCKNGFVPCE